MTMAVLGSAWADEARWTLPYSARSVAVAEAWVEALSERDYIHDREHERALIALSNANPAVDLSLRLDLSGEAWSGRRKAPLDGELRVSGAGLASSEVTIALKTARRRHQKVLDAVVSELSAEIQAQIEADPSAKMDEPTWAAFRARLGDPETCERDAIELSRSTYQGDTWLQAIASLDAAAGVCVGGLISLISAQPAHAQAAAEWLVARYGAAEYEASRTEVVIWARSHAAPTDALRDLPRRLEADRRIRIMSQAEDALAQVEADRARRAELLAAPPDGWSLETGPAAADGTRDARFALEAGPMEGMLYLDCRSRAVSVGVELGALDLEGAEPGAGWPIVLQLGDGQSAELQAAVGADGESLILPDGPTLASSLPAHDRLIFRALLAGGAPLDLTFPLDGADHAAAGVLLACGKPAP